MTNKAEKVVEEAAGKVKPKMTALGIGGAGAGVIVLVLILAQMSGGIKLLGDWTEKYRQSAKDELAHEQAHKIASEGVEKALEFVDCWPIGTCDGIRQLPVDDDQNESIKKLESRADSVEAFAKEHCQFHRDKGQRWHDCSKF